MFERNIERSRGWRIMREMGIGGLSVDGRVSDETVSPASSLGGRTNGFDR